MKKTISLLLISVVALTAPVSVFAAPGDIDVSFSSGSGPLGNASGYPGPNILDVERQSDGKLIVVGDFTSYNGTAINRIARLNTDGTLDTSFGVTTGANWPLRVIEQQSDGKFIVGGDLGAYNGTSRNGIVRINPDGTIDTSFNPGTGFNNSVFQNGVAIQPDGKIVVGGWFTQYNGTVTPCLIRLNADGTIDSSFNIGIGPDTVVHSVALQSDGKILVSGQFNTFNGISRPKIVRLNTDGSVDTSFSVGTGANNTIQMVSVQSDGKVLIAGDFTAYNGTAINRIARLNTDGTLDTSFGIGTGASGQVTFIKSYPSFGNQILIGGQFTSVNGVTRNRIARLNTDGTLDTSFDPGTGANNGTYAFLVQPDYKVVVGGFFTTINGVTRNRIARLEGAEAIPPVMQTLSPADEDTNVTIGTNLTISFSEPVVVDTGNIEIVRTSDSAVFETIPITSGQVTGSGTDTLTITLSGNLAYSTAYHVTIDATAVTDVFGNPFAGITNATDWNFTTESAPVVPPTPALSGSSTTGGIIYGCKDQQALNYELFVAHKPELCVYAPTIIPSVPAGQTTTTVPAALMGQVLRLGNKGTAVQELQKALNAKGANPALVADGVFGQKTFAAVRAFQTLSSLKVDGIAGAQTIGALFR